MTTDKSQTHRSELICSALRTAILERALLPGMKLPEDVLGERFGASRTLVRQALERLAAKGLVELRRNRGAAVATPSLEEARDLFELGTQIEDLLVTRRSRLGDRPASMGYERRQTHIRAPRTAPVFPE